MPFLVALWLAVLGALAPIASARTPAASGQRVVASVAWITSGAFEPTPSAAGGADTDFRPDAPRSLDESLRVTRPIARITAARGTMPAAHGPPAAVFATVPRLSTAVAFAARSRARSLQVSHAVTARGDVLPYFPTAPPLQG